MYNLIVHSNRQTERSINFGLKNDFTLWIIASVQPLLKKKQLFRTKQIWIPFGLEMCLLKEPLSLFLCMSCTDPWQVIAVCRVKSLCLSWQAVISGQQQSKWLQSFLSAKQRRVVNVYLEDDQQLDQVYFYLNGLYARAKTTSPCVAQIDRVPFVLDVLLPEVSRT